MHCMRYLRLLGALGLLTVAGYASGAQRPEGELTAFGLCELSQVVEQYEQPQSAAGYATKGPIAITEQTEVVPLRKGIAFGISWRATGLPEQADVKVAVEHPPITTPDGRRLETLEESMSHQSVDGTVETTDCYRLSEDHELVTGTWTIRIAYDGISLVKKTFRIVRSSAESIPEERYRAAFLSYMTPLVSQVLAERIGLNSLDAKDRSERVKLIAHEATECHMAALRRYSPELRRVAYSAAEKGGSYPDAKAALETAITREEIVGGPRQVEMRAMVTASVEQALRCMEEVKKRHTVVPGKRK